jgi:hypothetical protein
LVDGRSQREDDRIVSVYAVVTVSALEIMRSKRHMGEKFSVVNRKATHVGSLFLLEICTYASPRTRPRIKTMK